MRRKRPSLRWLLAGLSLLLLISGAAGAEQGTVETMLSQVGCLYSQCDLGTVTADAARLACGADFAVIPGGMIYQNLPGGSATRESVAQCFYGDEALAVCTVTPVQLKALMETGVSHIVTTERDTIDEEGSAFEGFPQISGFQVKCDYSALPGDRVLWIKTADGTELDLTDGSTTYTLVSTGELLAGGYGYTPLESTSDGRTMLDCLWDHIAAGRAKASGDPYTIIGIQGNVLMQNVSPIIPVLLTVMFLCVGAMTGGRVERKKRREQLEL